MISAKSEPRGWELICEIGRRVEMRRSGRAIDASKSILLDDGSLLCTPTGVSKGFMSPDMICRVDCDGDTPGRDAYRPSAEIKSHLRVYDCREDVGAVVRAPRSIRRSSRFAANRWSGRSCPNRRCFSAKRRLRPTDCGRLRRDEGILQGASRSATPGPAHAAQRSRPQSPAPCRLRTNRRYVTPSLAECWEGQRKQCLLKSVGGMAA